LQNNNSNALLLDGIAAGSRTDEIAKHTSGKKRDYFMYGCKRSDKDGSEKKAERHDAALLNP
jgi:hypothetical protein